MLKKPIKSDYCLKMSNIESVLDLEKLIYMYIPTNFT